jgi:bifunctional UDP-N-acetylglucosamine pyrophosphorylase/glucosamine-1-phosphate N-acetyltransferase
MILGEGVVHDVTAHIAETALVGVPYRPLLNGRQYRSAEKTEIGANAWIGEGVHVGRGAVIGPGTILHGASRVECNACLGERVLVTYRAFIDLEARIGDDSVIGGFVCERAVVGRGCRVFGDLAHTQANPLLGWDDDGSEEASPVLEDQVFVGWRAKVIGPVRLGARSYVCAGATVTRSVPSRHVAYGVNQVEPYDRWPGPLHDSPFFQG